MQGAIKKLEIAVVEVDTRLWTKFNEPVSKTDIVLVKTYNSQ
jgi:hypothetical protein